MNECEWVWMRLDGYRVIGRWKKRKGEQILGYYKDHSVIWEYVRTCQSLKLHEVEDVTNFAESTVVDGYVRTNI